MRGRPRADFGTRLRDQSGAALVVALLTIVIMMLLTAALVTASFTETFSAQTAEDSARAFLVADAAAARAIASLRLDPDWSDSTGCGSFLKDELTGACMQDVPYPSSGAIVVRPVSPPPEGSAEPKCAAVSVTGPVGSPPPLPPEQSFGRYTVTVGGNPESGRITLRAVGKVGRASRGFEFTVQRVTPADFVSYSALRVDATRVGNGTFRIHGSVYVRGNWEFHGNSQQLNDRPTSETDTLPYDNQTFVCSDLVLTGNPQIGESSRPMLGVHIAGSLIPRGSAYGIHALLQDKVVPDIRLGSVPDAVACIRGMGNQESCAAKFPGLWNTYTNEISASGNLVVLQRSSNTWQVNDSGKDLQLSTTAWRIPRRYRTYDCQIAGDNALDQVLAACAAYYDGSGNLYVAAGQAIYVPGRLEVTRDVNYRVDDDPRQACNPSAGEQDPCRKGDSSLIVVGCEQGTLCDPRLNSPAYGFDVREMLRAQRPASQGFFYPDTTFPSRDLLAVLVNGKVRFGLSGNPSNQEINLAVVSGCDASLPEDRCDLTMQKNLQLYGAVISRLLVFEQNVDLFQVPDLRRYLPIVLDNFLNAPGGAAVVVTSWRELGF